MVLEEQSRRLGEDWHTAARGGAAKRRRRRSTVAAELRLRSEARNLLLTS